MITAVDSSVLIDVFADDPEHAEHSANALRHCMQQGKVVACEIVWSELGTLFSDKDALTETMQTLTIKYSPLSEDTAILAWQVWRKYQKHNEHQTRIIHDFLIAAHAQVQCDRLLARDRGFYGAYFKKLKLVDPARM